MSSTPSKIPTFGSKQPRQVRESKSATSTPQSRDARRDTPGKTGAAGPRSEARKPRGALSASSTPLSVASSHGSKAQQGSTAGELSVSGRMTVLGRGCSEAVNSVLKYCVLNVCCLAR